MLVSTSLNDDIVDIEKPDGICSLTFDVDDFSGLFLHKATFLSKIQLIFSASRRHCNVTKIATSRFELCFET